MLSARWTLTGNFIKVNIEHLLLEVGLYHPLWTMQIESLANWSDTHLWIFHTVRFNHEMKTELNIAHTQLLGPQRINNRAIMELAISFSKKPTELKIIIRVRMLHDVIHLSDITTANGARIDPAILISDTFSEQRNECNCLQTHHVSPPDLTTWRRFINYIYSFDDFRLK